MVSPETDRDKEERKLRELDNIRDRLKIFNPLLDDPELTDIFCLSNGDVSVKRFGRPITEVLKAQKNLNLSVSERYLLLNQIADFMEQTVNFFEYPVLEATIPVPEWKNARITGIYPPWLPAPGFTIRKPPDRIYTLEDYVAHNQMRKEYYDLVVSYIKEPKNIIISGSTNSGKTTFANAVLQKKTEFFPTYRYFIVQDTSELQCKAKFAEMVMIRMDQSLKAVMLSLRYSPNCIVFGEVRTGVIMLELLKAWNTGHPGGFTTIHANSSLLTIPRIKELLYECLQNENAFPDINECVDLIVFLRQSKETGVQVSEVLETKKIKHSETEHIMADYAKKNPY